MPQGSPITNFLNAPAVENAAQTARMNDIQLQTGNEKLDTMRQQKQQQREYEQLKRIYAGSKLAERMYVEDPEQYAQMAPKIIREFQLEGIIAPTQDLNSVEPADWRQLKEITAAQLSAMQPETRQQGNPPGTLQELDRINAERQALGQEPLRAEEYLTSRRLTPTGPMKEYEIYTSQVPPGQVPMTFQEWKSSSAATAAAEKEQAVTDVRTDSELQTQQRINQQAFDSIMVPMEEFMRAADQVWGVRERGKDDPNYLGAIQVARASRAQMAPALKQMFRAAGEGVFTDRDQQILIDMIPGLLTEPTARKRIMDNMMSIIRFKMGLPLENESPYQPGDIIDGYRYTGGDWKNPDNYEEVNNGQ